MDKEFVNKRAQAIATALQSKLPGYRVFPRLIEHPSYNYVEFGVAKPAEPQHEIQVAYSAEYVEGMVSPEVTTKRARRILADIKQGLGMPPDAESAQQS